MTPDLITKVQPFAIALALGLLIGIERERSHPVGEQPFGLRTFILFSLLGALAGRLNEPMITLSLTLFVGAVVIAGYLRSGNHRRPQSDIGITTEVAAVLIYGLGYFANREPFITLLIGVVTMVVLLARGRLHKFSRSQLRPKELQATATILVLAIGILPFLPDKLIDPWQLFNPQRFGILILIIAALQFCAYAGIRMFGASQGILLSGFLAGFVSSTAATATLSQQAVKHRAPPLTIAAAVVLATAAMFLETIVVIFISSPTLLYTAGIPIFTTALVFSVIALLIGKIVGASDGYPVPDNPLSLSSALRLALFLGTMLVIITLAQRWLGTTGASIIIFLGGLFEVHGVTLALASLHHQGQLSAYAATNNIALAIGASFVSKYMIIWAIEHKRFALYTSILLTLMLALFVCLWGVGGFLGSR